VLDLLKVFPGIVGVALPYYILLNDAQSLVQHYSHCQHKTKRASLFKWLARCILTLG
jgi:hypothetical protein